MHEESYDDEVFRDEVLADHPGPWLRLRAQRVAAPPWLRSFDQDKVQQTLGRNPGCKRSIGCALNRCRVVFATAGMVANRHRLLLGAAPGRPQTRFAVSFVDEASGHNIPVGLDLAAMGSQCPLCGDPGHLRPYGHIQVLAAAYPNVDLKPKDIAWPTPDSFKYHNVDMSQGPAVHVHDSHRFCTTNTLHFCLYRTRCRANVLAHQYRMNMPLATVMRALFTGGGGALTHPPPP